MRNAWRIVLLFLSVTVILFVSGNLYAEEEKGKKFPVYIYREGDCNEGKEISREVDPSKEKEISVFEITNLCQNDILNTTVIEGLVGDTNNGIYHEEQPIDEVHEEQLTGEANLFFSDKLYKVKAKLGPETSVRFEKGDFPIAVEAFPIKEKNNYIITEKGKEPIFINYKIVSTDIRKLRSITLIDGKIRICTYLTIGETFTINAGGLVITCNKPPAEPTGTTIGTDTSTLIKADLRVDYDLENDLASVYVFEGSVSIEFKRFLCYPPSKKVFGGQRITYSGCEDPDQVSMTSVDEASLKSDMEFTDEKEGLIAVYNSDELSIIKLSLNGIDLSDVNSLKKRSLIMAQTDANKNKLKGTVTDKKESVTLLLKECKKSWLEMIDGDFYVFFTDNEKATENSIDKTWDNGTGNVTAEKWFNGSWLYGTWSLVTNKWTSAPIDGKQKDENWKNPIIAEKDHSWTQQLSDIENKEYVLVLIRLKEDGKPEKAEILKMMGFPEETPEYLKGTPVKRAPGIVTAPGAPTVEPKRKANDFMNSFTNSIGRGDTSSLYGLVAGNYSGNAGGFTSRSALINAVRDFFLTNNYLTISNSVGSISSTGNEITFDTTWTAVSNTGTKTGRTSWWIKKDDGKLFHAEGDWFF